MNRHLILIVAVCLVLMAPPVMAGTIEYSWEGTIEPKDPNEDPWGIGAGQPFFISAAVDSNEIVEVDYTLIPLARFTPRDIVLVIGGETATWRSDSLDAISFFVSSFNANLVSQVGISLRNVRINGTSGAISTVVRMPEFTFTLDSPFEPPPIFPSTPAFADTHSGTFRSSYSTITETGALVSVTVIPEPSTFVLACIALLGLGCNVRRNRKR